MEFKSEKPATLRKSASAYLRRKLSSKAPSRATTLPVESSTSKTSKDTCVSMLHPTKLCENPRIILHNVAEYFSKGLELNFSSDDASIESTPSTSSRTQSPVENTNPSLSQRSPSLCQGKSRHFQSQTWPPATRPILGRSKSEPAHESKPTPLNSYPGRYSSHSKLDLSRCENSMTTIKFSSTPNSQIHSPKPSPLSKEIVCEIEEVDPLPRAAEAGSSRAIPRSQEKENDLNPRLASKIKSKCEKSIPLGDSSEKQILHKGIVAHQKNDMTLSAILFERCAKENGGCGVGMLMWALALRHGWGCPVDTLKAFGWLQLSIETLLRELHHAKLEKQHYDELHSNEGTPKDLLLAQYLINETNGIKSELLLALYELGQCLMYGWGCPRDKRLAVQYYHLAATLGDADAQKELAYCYEVGNGVKRSSRNAAKYYRMACAQGIKMMGYQWIWKDKYDPVH
ncbi:hypothetical protein PGT21_003496 [Puccinia graminis f. sp. tritici]|uniref:Uncharacterized protein n=2 Tax=Puccinia graminis f. sp. tritici TaxID=56615 RepID=E3JTT7_PUCGT|nr:uncharacterized protein PGTG_00750 [Puccinia graminis f. sp. tritici CRL 75-36-700-3]EFP75419.2 hypothetical protein PGTG_00750 [Puccinia graminis f. sp. tritici CRL 75-36-700-3]KAA1116174.1 hypothetical protein PGT21_003496 [Puccinia graminis f. sp. tritici]KAA1130456.1 hypothetical protein PGTUg99_021829 [Puccinia graminis f. sp. tritici]